MLSTLKRLLPTLKQMAFADEALLDASNDAGLAIYDATDNANARAGHRAGLHASHVPQKRIVREARIVRGSTG